jgi:outer membrane lipoprotein-sorting protein
MEQPILKCKTFKADVEIAVGPGKDTTLKGRLLVARGNKVRLELAGAVKGKRGKMAAVSDGTKMRMTQDVGVGKDQETPKQLGEIVLASVTRTGVFVPMFLLLEGPGEKREPFDIDKEYSVSDIKLGKKETASGKQTQTLHYKLTTKAAKEPLAVTVWVDVKTHLLVKRVVTVKVDKEMFTITETYTKPALDQKIDAKEFELPK